MMHIIQTTNQSSQLRCHVRKMKYINQLKISLTRSSNHIPPSGGLFILTHSTHVTHYTDYTGHSIGYLLQF